MMYYDKLDNSQSLSKILFFDMVKECRDHDVLFDKIQGGHIYKSKMHNDLVISIITEEYKIIEFNYFSKVAIRNKFGYVYVIEGSHKGKKSYKIGKANDLKERLKKFEVKIPFDIDLFASFLVKNPIEFESVLHKEYKNKRLAGEWFDLSVEDMTGIIKIGAERELSDLKQATYDESEMVRKAKWKNDKDYIEYLEDVLVFNNIKFEARI